MAQPQASHNERRNSTSSSSSNSSSGSRSPRVQHRSFWGGILDTLPQKRSPSRTPTRRSSHSKSSREALNSLTPPPSPSRSPTRKLSHSKLPEDLLTSPQAASASTSAGDEHQKQSVVPLESAPVLSQTPNRASSREKLPKPSMDPLTPPPSPKRTPARRSSHSTIPEEGMKLRAAPPSPSALQMRASSREKIKKAAPGPLAIPPSPALPPTRSPFYSTIPEEELQPMAAPPTPSTPPIRASPCEVSTKPILDLSTIHPPSPVLPLTHSPSHSTMPEEELQLISAPPTPSASPMIASPCEEHTKAAPDPLTIHPPSPALAPMRSPYSTIPEEQLQPVLAPPVPSTSPMRASPHEEFAKPILDPLTIHSHSLVPPPTRSSSHATLPKKSSGPLTPPPSPPRSLKRTSSHSTHPKQAGDSKTKKAHREHTKVQLPDATQPQTKPVKLESFARRMESKSRKPQDVRLEEKKAEEIVGPANYQSVQTEPVDVANPIHIVEPVMGESLGKEEESRSEKLAVAYVGEEKVQQPISPMDCLSIQPPTHPKGKIIIHCLRHAQAFHNLGMIPRSDRLNFHDPGITPEGRAQAKRLCKTLGSNQSITHILSSPLRRTLQTALYGLAPVVIKKNLKVIAYPDLREWGNSPCSTGSKMRDVLEKLPGRGQKVDVGLVPSEWEVNKERKRNGERVERVKIDLWNLGRESLGERGRWRGREVGRGEGKGDEGAHVEIVVVSHAAFLGTLEGTDVERLRNAQWRTYEFATEEDMKATNCKPYALFETAESKRRNDPVLPTPEEVVLSRKKVEAAEKAKEKARNLRRGW